MKNYTDITNLRRDSDYPEIWRRVGMPKPLASASALPIADFPLSENSAAMLLAAGKSLYFSFGSDPLAARRSFLGNLAGEPLRVDSSVPGLLKIFCRDAAPEYASYTTSGQCVLRGPLPQLPKIPIRPSVSGEYTQWTSRCSLSGDSRRQAGNSLAYGDRLAVTAQLRSAYKALRADVERAGAAFQPLLARYRLRDAFGDTVFLSAPVLLSYQLGFQVTNPVNFGSYDSMAHFEPCYIDAYTYYISLLAPESLPDPWNLILPSLELECTPQLDLVDLDETASGSYHMIGGDELASASVTLPGVPSTESARKAACRSLVVKALERVESLMRPVAKVRNPFGGALGTPGTAKWFSPGKGFVNLARLEAVEPRPLQNPATNYSALFAANGLSLKADPSSSLPLPLPAPSLAALADGPSGEWKSAVGVTVSRGSLPDILLSEAAGNGKAPSVLGPLLVYPDPRATEISVSVLRPDGSALSNSFPLTPLPEAGLAYWLDPSIHRVSLPEAPFGYETPLPSVGKPDLKRSLEIYPDGAETPSESIPFPAGIRAFAEAPRSRSTWDFSRNRIVCFADDGISLLVLDTKGTLRSLSRLDPRPVDRPDAVALASGPDGARLLAIAGGDLIAISGSKVETLLPRCRATRPAWNPVFNEIWLFDPSSSPRRLTPDGEIITVDLAGITSETIPLLWKGSLLLGSSGALYNASLEQPLPTLPVSLSLSSSSSPPKVSLLCGASVSQRLPLLPAVQNRCFVPGVRHQSAEAASFSPRGAPSLLIPLSAKNFQGSVTLSGHNGSGIFGPLATLKVSGQVNAPLRIPLLAPCRSTLRLSLSGLASPDLSLSLPAP